MSIIQIFDRRLILNIIFLNTYILWVFQLWINFSRIAKFDSVFSRKCWKIHNNLICSQSKSRWGWYHIRLNMADYGERYLKVAQVSSKTLVVGLKYSSLSTKLRSHWAMDGFTWLWDLKYMEIIPRLGQI